MLGVVQLVVAIMCLLTLTMEGARTQRQQVDLTPTMTSGKETPCITKNNQQGVCVDESACNEEHTIVPTGLLHESDFREKKPSPCQVGYWCCTSGEIPPPQIAASESGKETPCITKNNQQGVCVDESACNEEHTILDGGDVHNSDYREKKPCKEGYWCCTSGKIPPPQIAASKSDKCLALESDVCPWCVFLYKNREVKPTAGGPFCLGALIGSRVIITSATCLMSAQHKLLYARVPNSADPGKNITVTRRQLHPNYNSGSHEYDIGIVVIESDVAFDSGKSRGACVDFQTPLEGTCVGYGFDSEGQIQSTIMTVKKKSCGKAGNSKDAACGMNSDEVCIVSEGAPVVCPKHNRDMHLVGISRGVCNDDDQVTLGDISHSREWIEELLESMNVSKDLYT